jgi:ethanolamine ammonia-lyase small subunit
MPDPWHFLRAHTPARLALGRVGGSVPTAELLAFQLAHAQARDAVFSELDLAALEPGLAELGQVVRLQSQAPHRQAYLQRPDWGRRLHPSAAQRLAELAPAPADVVFVLADGLSADALNRQALPTLRHLCPRLRDAGWTMGPLVLVEQGRVAVGDEVGYLCRAQAVVMLLGERPGLSSPDSLGAYLTWGPAPGLTDERRNCVSNIRPQGLGHAAAADKLFYLLTEMRRQQLSGVGLKDMQLGALPGHFPTPQVTQG